MNLIDNYLVAIGGFGCYQKIVIVFLSLIPINVTLNILALVFTAYTPEHTCSKFLPNTDWYHNGSNICEISNVTEICIEWDFDKSVMRDSIVTQFNLVCDKKWYVATAKTVSMCGLLLGTLSSSLADRFGRKRLLLVSSVLLLLSNIGSIFSQNYILFIIFRFISSACAICTFSGTMIIALELIPSTYTPHSNSLISLSLSIGYMILTALAYAFRERKHLELAITCYGLLLIIGIIKVPESPKWLYARQRIDEADTILREIAERNGCKFEKNKESLVIEKLTNEKPLNESYINIFSDLRLSVSAFVLYFCWFSSMLMFYGLTFIVESFDGDLYMNSFYNGLVEIPGPIAVLISSKYLGRKSCLIASFFFSGVLMLSTLIIPSNLSVIFTVIGMIGKAFSKYEIVLLSLYTGEFYPTSIRASGFAVSLMIGRIGGAIAPLMLEAGSSKMIIMCGCASLIAGVLMLFPPETKGRVIPQTINDCKGSSTNP